MTIGVSEGGLPYELFRVVGAARLSDGRVVVANAGTNELRFFDPAGRYLKSAGREGDGPGEFRDIWLMERFDADSLVVYDAIQRRISIFDPEGVHVRDVSLAARGWISLVVAVGRFSDGSYLGRAGYGQASRLSPGRMRDSVLALRIGPDRDTVDTLVAFPDRIRHVQRRSSGSSPTTFRSPIHFTPHTIMAACADRMLVGTGDTYELRAYGLDGSLSSIIRKEQVALPVTTADVDSVLAQYRERRSGDPGLDEFMEAQEKVPAAETMPAYRSFRADSDGNLWVEEYRRPSDYVPRWSVFDPEGHFLGTVTGPERFSVTDIGTSYVLGIVKDQTGVERVILYGLAKPSPPPSDRGTAGRGAAHNE
ncbi:MAG: 6-bladed beta-propeller [Armatimonadota bacterium]